MLKETASIIRAGLAERIYLVGRWEPSLPQVEDLGDGRSIVRLKCWAGRLPRSRFFGLLLQAEITLRLLHFCNKVRPSVVHCHWLEALPVGWFYKELISRGTALVYDAHELETEKYGVHNTLKRPVFKWIESRAIRSADLVLVVSPSIAAWYQQTYTSLNLAIVRNIPSRRAAATPTAPVDFRQLYRIPDDAVIFLYQGRLSPARGIEPLLEVFSSLSNRYHIIFLGYGPLEHLVRKSTHASGNTHLHPPVPPERLLDYTAAADVGLALIADACPSYFFCLPNKLFEYIIAGVPVVASDFPDMATIVRKYGCGWPSRPDVKSVRETIIGITVEDLTSKKAAAQIASEILDWKTEALTLIDAYKQIFHGTASPGEQGAPH